MSPCTNAARTPKIIVATPGFIFDRFEETNWFFGLCPGTAILDLNSLTVQNDQKIISNVNQEPFIRG